MEAMNSKQFLEHLCKGKQLPEWITIQQDPARMTIPQIHPAFGLRQGEARVHDGVIIEHLPDTMRRRC